MSVDEGMPVDVAKSLLAHKRVLPEVQWRLLKAAYRRARSSFSAPIALRIAEQAIFKKPSQRPPV